MAALTIAWIRKQALDLGLYGQSDYTPFIIMCRSRVGSNLLRGLLDAHQQVAIYGEIFRDSRSFDWDHIGYFQSRRMHALMQQDPVSFVDRRVFGRYPGFVRAVGFKLFYYHARAGAESSVWSYLRDRPNVKVIHLRRRNLLETHLSRKRAALTGRWVETSNGNGRSGGLDHHGAIRLDYQECLADFAQTRSWEEECGRYFSGHTTLEVQYETLASNPSAEAERIQTFLNVDVISVRPATVKQKSRPLSGAIANYAELKDQFSGTSWAEFFTE
jgi:LPS sulfotransferase NodH